MNRSSSESREEDFEDRVDEQGTPTPRIPMAKADIELIISQIKDMSSYGKERI